MRDIALKNDNVGDLLSADTFNANFVSELQAIVDSADLVLDPESGPDTDLYMLAKALVLYSGASQYYVESGTADAYVLTRTGNLQALPAYFDGITVLFKPTNTNTGASTINVDGLGVKALVLQTGAALTGGEVVTDNYVLARYRQATDSFEMVTGNFAIDALVLHKAGDEIKVGTLDLLPLSSSITDNESTLVVEESGGWSQGIAIGMNNAQGLNSSRPSAFLGVGNAAGRAILSAGARLTGDTSLTNWATPVATTATFLELNQGFFKFYGDTGLTPGVTYTPTDIFACDSTGNLYIRNAKNLYGADSGGTPRSLIGVNGSNYATFGNGDIQTAIFGVSDILFFDGLANAQGIKAKSLLVSNSYGSSPPTNGIYSLGVIESGVSTGTAPFTIASTTVVPNLNADLFDGLHSTKLSWGHSLPHTTFSDFNTFLTSGYFGVHHVTGDINGPGHAGATQYYHIRSGIGSEYDNYSMQWAIPREMSDAYLYYRWEVAGVASGWYKMRAGYSDNSGQLNGYTIGTSGATIPLLSNANTFSASQIVAKENPYLRLQDTTQTSMMTFSEFNGAGYVQVTGPGYTGGGDLYFFGDSSDDIGTIYFKTANLYAYSSAAWQEIWHKGNDGGLVHSTGDESISGIKTFDSQCNFSNDYIVVGNNLLAGQDSSGDAFMQFWDDTNNAYRSMGWDDTNHYWFMEDSGGTNRQVWTAGENASVGAGSGITGTFTTTDAKTITVTNGIVTAIV